MNFNLNFNNNFNSNNFNRGNNNPPKFNQSGYKLNYQTPTDQVKPKNQYTSVDGRKYDNYENVRIANHQFIDEMNKGAIKKSVK